MHRASLPHAQDRSRRAGGHAADGIGGGDRASSLATAIETAKPTAVDPDAWLSDTVIRVAGQPIN